MTISEIRSSVDVQIRQKTAPGSITNEEVSGILDSILDISGRFGLQDNLLTENRDVKLASKDFRIYDGDIDTGVGPTGSVVINKGLFQTVFTTGWNNTGSDFYLTPGTFQATIKEDNEAFHTRIHANSRGIDINATAKNLYDGDDYSQIDILPLGITLHTYDYTEDGPNDSKLVIDLNGVLLTQNTSQGFSNILFPRKSGSYVVPITVNNVAADEFGNIATEGGGGGRFGVEDNISDVDRVFNLNNHNLLISGGSILNSQTGEKIGMNAFPNGNALLGFDVDKHGYLQLSAGNGHEGYLQANLLTDLQYYELPNNSGTLPLSVNNQFADSNGNIVLTEDAPDTLISTGAMILTGLSLSIAPNVVWRIANTTYTKSTTSSFTITAAATEMYRKDLIYANTSGGLTKIEGTEDAYAAIAPDTPANTIVVAVVDVYGETATPPVPVYPDLNWHSSGNTALSSDFIGTTNNQSLLFKVNNTLLAKLDTDGMFKVNKGMRVATDGGLTDGLGAFYVKTGTSPVGYTEIGIRPSHTNFDNPAWQGKITTDGYSFNIIPGIYSILKVQANAGMWFNGGNVTIGSTTDALLYKLDVTGAVRTTGTNFLSSVYGRVAIKGVICDESTTLDLTSNVQGLGLPRLTMAQRDALNRGAASIVVTDPGLGYLVAPVLSFLASPVGLQPTGTATINGTGSVDSTSITYGGSYNIADATVVFSAPPAGGTRALGNVVMTASRPRTGLTIFCTDQVTPDATTGVAQTWNGTAWKSHWGAVLTGGSSYTLPIAGSSTLGGVTIPNTYTGLAINSSSGALRQSIDNWASLNGGSTQITGGQISTYVISSYPRGGMAAFYTAGIGAPYEFSLASGSFTEIIANNVTIGNPSDNYTVYNIATGQGITNVNLSLVNLSGYAADRQIVISNSSTASVTLTATGSIVPDIYLASVSSTYLNNITLEAGCVITLVSFQTSGNVVRWMPIGKVAKSTIASGGGGGVAITLTTVGTSGAATYNGVTGALNIPNYAGGAGSQTPWTSNIVAAGFTLYGNTTSGGTLTIASTSNAVKGKIILGTTSAYDEANVRLGIGTTTPSYTMDVRGSLAAGNTTSPIKLLDWGAGFATSWLDMPVVAGKTTAIGHGGVGQNAWIAYIGAADQWFLGAAAGDLGYRNSIGRILIGNAGTIAAAIAVTSDRVGIGGLYTPTAYLHLKAGTATANTAPIKLTAGTVLTTPESGAFEYDSSHIYFTVGSTRYQLDQQGGTYNLPISSASVLGGVKVGTGLAIDGAGVLTVTSTSGLNGTGFVKATGTTISYDNTTYQPVLVSGTSIKTVNGVSILGSGDIGVGGGGATGANGLSVSGGNVVLGGSAVTTAVTLDAGSTYMPFTFTSASNHFTVLISNTSISSSGALRLVHSGSSGGWPSFSIDSSGGNSAIGISSSSGTKGSILVQELAPDGIGVLVYCGSNSGVGQIGGAAGSFNTFTKNGTDVVTSLNVGAYAFSNAGNGIGAALTFSNTWNSSNNDVISAKFISKLTTVSTRTSSFEIQTVIANVLATRMSIGITGILKIVNVPSYASNAAAVSGGLVAGEVYKIGNALQII